MKPNKNISPIDLRKLNALVRDEHEAAEDYAYMSNQFSDMGNAKLSNVFKKMSREEAGHRDNIRTLIKAIKIAGKEKPY